MSQTFMYFVLFFFVIFIKFVLNERTIIQPEWKIYYNLTTNQTIDVIDSNNPRTQYYKIKNLPKILRIGFGPIPCTCQSFTCGCCSGIKIQEFDFDRRACMNLTYYPYDFAMQLDMYMNDESLLSQRVSAKNPPPACMPVPMPLPFAPSIDFCIKLFNIHTPGYNIFMCMDFETRIVRAPILILHFDCLQLGTDGIFLLKPEDAQTKPDVEDPDDPTPNPSDIEVYDEVFEEPTKNRTSKIENIKEDDGFKKN